MVANFFADLFGTAVGMLIGYPWIIVIGILISRHPFGRRKSYMWFAGGSLVSVISVDFWFVFVERQYGSESSPIHYLAAILATLLSGSIFRGIRKLRVKSGPSVADSDR